MFSGLQEQGHGDGAMEKERGRVVLVDSADQDSDTDDANSPPLSPGAPPHRGNPSDPSSVFPEHHSMFSDISLDFVPDLSDDTFFGDSSVKSVKQPPFYQQPQHDTTTTTTTNGRKLGGLQFSNNIFDFAEMSKSLPDSHGMDSTLFLDPHRYNDESNEGLGSSLAFNSFTQPLGYREEPSAVRGVGNVGSLQDSPRYIFDLGNVRTFSTLSSSLGTHSMVGNANGAGLSSSAGMGVRGVYPAEPSKPNSGICGRVGSLQDRPFTDNFSELYLPKHRQYQQSQQPQQYPPSKLKQQVQPGMRAYNQRSQNTSKNVLQIKQSQSQNRNNARNGGNLSSSIGSSSNNNNNNSNNGGCEESNASRTLFVRNLNPSSEDSEIHRVFSCFGEVKNVSYQSKYRGFVTVTYYDIRSSMNALIGLQGRYLHGSPLDVYYSHEACRDGNQGSLHITLSAVPGIDPFTGGLLTPESDIFCECAKYGEVKAVFPSSLGRNAYVAEFFDLRAAEVAHSQITSICGRPVRVEYAAHTGFVGSSAPLMADMAHAQSSQFRANATPFKPRKQSPHLQRVTPTNAVAAAANTPFSSSTPANVVGPLAQNGATSYNPQMTSSGPNGGSNNNNSGNSIKRRTTPFADTRTQKQGIGGLNKGNGNVAQRYRRVPDNVKDFYSVCVVNGMVNDFRTTLMIRNIPNKYTQKMLLDSIDQIIPGSYNFFYLPIDFQNQCNVGYAFINMSNTKFIPALYERFHNKGWELFNSEKICEVAYARIQGLQKLVDHFRNSSLLSEDEKVRPVVLIGGKLVPFPVGVSLVVKKISPNELIV